MISENSVIYRFLCISWVLMTMVHRNRFRVGRSLTG